MFVDQADIFIHAGDGGRGCVSFRKEKYIPQGGPDGGDGGDGGSVYMEAAEGVDTLLDMAGRHHWYAKPGGPGLGKKKAGADGTDLLIRVPAGTLIYDKTSGLLIADLKTFGQKVCIGKGGKGGKGNINFVNSVRQAPDFAEPGQAGQVRELHLELRLIADVGIVGLPNAGKSTLLSRFTHARPKIADYPFTTLSPQLGIAELDAERRIVIADIPGLIEGASEGAGLGLEFLRHIERTRVLVHMIDVLPFGEEAGKLKKGSRPIDFYKKIRKELEAYSPKLASKPEILVANKMDLAGASEALADLRQALPGKQIFALSAVAGSGLRPLLEALWQQVQRAPISDPLVDERPYIPPAPKPTRTEEDMFVYVNDAADEGAWDPINGAADDEAIEPDHTGYINAIGLEVPPPKPRPTRRQLRKAKRTKIEPVATDGRKTAKARKAAHTQRVKDHFPVEPPVPTGKAAKIAKVAKAVEVVEAVLPPKKKTKLAPKAAPVEIAADVDTSLAAEVAAMKADDARKSKFYKRRKADI